MTQRRPEDQIDYNAPVEHNSANQDLEALRELMGRAKSEPGDEDYYGIDWESLKVDPSGSCPQVKDCGECDDDRLELSGDFQEEGEEANEMAVVVLGEEQKRIWEEIQRQRQDFDDRIHAELAESRRRVEQLVVRFGSRVQPVAPPENPNLKMVVSTAKIVILGCGALFVIMFACSLALSVWMALNGHAVR